MKHSDQSSIAVALFGFLSLVTFGLAVDGAEPVAIVLTAPKTNQVVQRVGFDLAAAQQKPEGAALGFADVAVRGNVPKGTERATWEYRVIAIKKNQAARDGLGQAGDSRDRREV